jgi:hypothetical protein
MDSIFESMPDALIALLTAVYVFARVVQNLYNGFKKSLQVNETKGMAPRHGLEPRFRGHLECGTTGGAEQALRPSSRTPSLHVTGYSKQDFLCDHEFQPFRELQSRRRKTAQKIFLQPTICSQAKNGDRSSDEHARRAQL